MSKRLKIVGVWRTRTRTGKVLVKDTGVVVLESGAASDESPERTERDATAPDDEEERTLRQTR
jgi:hypothetical protein